RAANQLMLFRLPGGSNEREQGLAVGGRDCDPAAHRFIALIEDDIESELLHEKMKATLLIADKDVDAENAKIRILAVQAGIIAVGAIVRRAGHRGDYKTSGPHIRRSCAIFEIEPTAKRCNYRRPKICSCFCHLVESGWNS